MFHIWILHLLVVTLLLVCNDWLVRFEILADSLIDGLFTNFVIVGGLYLDHVFQIVYIVCIELGALGVSTSSSILLVYIYADISLSLGSDFQGGFVGCLHCQWPLCILLLTSGND